MTIKRQIQNVIKNLGKNLDNIKVYNFFIFNMNTSAPLKRLQRYTKKPNKRCIQDDLWFIHGLSS